MSHVSRNLVNQRTNFDKFQETKFHDPYSRLTNMTLQKLETLDHLRYVLKGSSLESEAFSWHNISFVFQHNMNLLTYCLFS